MVATGKGERARGAPGEVSTAFLAAAAVVTVGVSLLAYGQSLGAGFSEIDDPTLLDGVARGESFTQHFRPAYVGWNELLYACFGDAARAFRACDLALHVFSASACALLARRLLGRNGPALAGAAVFAAFRAPAEAVLWIAANNGLLSVAGTAAAALAWEAFLRTGSKRAFLAAHVAAVAALASKQDALLLVPLFVGLDLARNGRAALAPRAAAVRYALLALLLGIYLPLAYRPRVWLDDPGVGRYALEPALLSEWFGNFALLFSLVERGGAERAPAAVAAGLALAASIGVLAFASRAHGRTLALGLALALVGLAPALPGPMQVAGSRLCYPSAIGVALMSAALWDLAESAAGRIGRARPVRIAAILALAAWTGASALAIRSVERWRYAPRAERLQHSLGATRAALAEARAAGARELAVLAPPLWNPQDYASAARHFLFAGVADARLAWLAPEADLARAVEPGGVLSPLSRAVRVGQHDGSLLALATPAEIAAAARAALDAPRGVAIARRALPVVALELRRP